MRRVNVLRLLSLLPLTLLFAACAKEPSSAVTPKLRVYSRDVQARAADELQAMPAPCAPDAVAGNCSAVKRLVVDYKTTRDEIRAIKKKR